MVSVNAITSNVQVMANLIFSGVLDRFPELRFTLCVADIKDAERIDQIAQSALAWLALSHFPDEKSKAVKERLAELMDAAGLLRHRCPSARVGGGGPGWAQLFLGMQQKRITYF